MPLDPTIALQGVDTNQDSSVQGTQIAGAQQQQAQSAAAFPTQQSLQQLNLQKQKMDLGLSLMRTVTDQPSYDKAKSVASSYGIDTSYLPDTYSPQLQQQLMYANMTAAQALNNQLRAANIQTKAGTSVGDPTAFTPAGSAGANVLGLNGSASPPMPPAQAAPPAVQGSPSPSTGLTPSATPPVDPLAASQQAIAAQQGQTGVSPGQNAQYSNMVNNPQSAPIPPMSPGVTPTSVPQKGPYETTAAYAQRLKASGDVEVNQLMDAAAGQGNPITRAQAEAIKAGRDTAMNAQGQLAPLPGAQSAATQMGAAQAQGKLSADYVQDMNENADGALQTMRITKEMQNLSQNLTTGELAPLRAKLGSWGVALGIPEDQVQQMVGSAGDAQALGKLTAQLATASVKQISSRPAQMEWASMLQNNPNIAMTPQGFNTVMDFIQKTAAMPIQKQQQFLAGPTGDGKTTYSPEQYPLFEAKWTQNQAQNLASTLPAPQGNTQQAAPQQNSGMSSIAPASIQRLRANPGEAALFDQRYGQGAAAQVLGAQ